MPTVERAARVGRTAGKAEASGIAPWQHSALLAVVLTDECGAAAICARLVSRGALILCSSTSRRVHRKVGTLSIDGSTSIACSNVGHGPKVLNAYQIGGHNPEDC